MAADQDLEHVRSYLDAGGYADWQAQFTFNLDRAIAAIADLLPPRCGGLGCARGSGPGLSANRRR
jgi:hypothetical protein